MSYPWMAIVGLVVGLVARAVLPGGQRIGVVLAAFLGIAGALLAAWAGAAVGLYRPGAQAGLFASGIGATVLLFLIGQWQRR